MATATPTPRRTGRGPGRPRVRPLATPDSAPPHKRLKYTPKEPEDGVEADVSENWPEPIGEQEGDEIAAGEPTIALGKVEIDEELEGLTPMHNVEERQSSPRTTRRPASYARPRRDPDRARTRGRLPASPRPRYSSAAAAAAATQASDGYKPREERSWEEFHPDLDIEATLNVYTADAVDGRPKTNIKPSFLRNETTNRGESLEGDDALADGEQASGEAIRVQPAPSFVTPKRKPGRPPRRPESMLSGLGSPPAPKIVPLPTHNPKERLNLPKPSFKIVETFENFERGEGLQVNYVDKPMAHVGYQEHDRFDLPKQAYIRHADGILDDEADASLFLESDVKDVDTGPAHTVLVEYDMDEQDERWLEAYNSHRKDEQVDPIKPAFFEITMTHIEREYYALEKRIPKPNPRHAQHNRPRSSSAAAVNGEPPGTGDEPDSKCAICDDGDCENANAIIFCDGCDLAVHQECYGVPFIPEGQWFCRKCKEIGRGTPVSEIRGGKKIKADMSKTCIFCPNIDGAFKQTNTLRWSHLLCAIWIPEVTIANNTFMEPIQDVEKVPKSRWSLHCYICNQRMGACIQCGNKACYQAFHVTCARRARLFLRMKSTQVGGIDPSVFKAFCDRHVPSEWRRDHGTDRAIVEAKRYYRHTMRDRRWADSQTAALAMGASQLPIPADQIDELGQGEDGNTIVVAGTKRKKGQPQKTGWRLPSGAPIVPAVVFNAIEASLARFSIRKRKEFVAEACKYWTLKREARRGAALLKRLQLQLESFSSMEVTRRNFVGMGAAGKPRLLRRIDFADMLIEDVDRLSELVTKVHEREHRKLADAEILKKLIDTVYFPMPDLLWPILQRAQKLDEKNKIFHVGFDILERRLAERHYTSISAFSADIGAVFSSVLDTKMQNTLTSDVSAIHNHLHEIPAGTTEHQALSQEQKELKKLAKRIVKAVKEPLEGALKKELELKGLPFEKEMSEWANLDARLENSVALSRRASLATMPLSNGDARQIATDVSVSAIGGASPTSKHSRTGSTDVEMRDVPESLVENNITGRLRGGIHSVKQSTEQPTEPLSPPISASSAALDRAASISAASSQPNDDPWAHGGVPWYMQPFDPVGTTVHDERWTGPEHLRAMSEALSEMDEDTLMELEQSNISDNTPVGRGRTRSSAAARVEEQQSEADRLAKEKKEQYNAKRRVQRRKAKAW